MDENTPGNNRLFPHNPLEGFGNGALLDLRVRIAVNLLQYSSRYSPASGHNQSEGRMGVWQPRAVALDALDVADALLNEALARGWVTPLSTDGELTPELRSQAKTHAQWSVLQQLEAGKFAAAEQDRVAVPAGHAAGRH